MARKKIVIAGAGFGGITVVLTLVRMLGRKRLLDRYELVLIDRNAYHLYTPALYEIASIPKGEASATALKSSIAILIEEITAGKPIAFIQETVVALKPQEKQIQLSGETLEYEYAVIALGSETAYFNIPGLAEHSYPLKRFEDAVRIRNRIEELLRQDRPLSILVAGGGSTGVELIAEFSNFICALQEKVLPQKTRCEITLTLIEASPEILPGFAPWFVERARRRLEKLGIAVRCNAIITAVLPDTITLGDGRRLPYDLLVWAGGVTGLDVFKSFELPLTKKGNIAVNQFLEAAPDLYAIGDAAGVRDPRTGKLLIWNVPVAEMEAHTVARNIVQSIAGKNKIPFRAMSHYPFILAVGRKYAIADLVVARCWGLLGWGAKLLVELRYLVFILPLVKAIRYWVKAVLLYRAND